jgi:phage baseplate assembly protein gpV
MSIQSSRTVAGFAALAFAALLASGTAPAQAQAKKSAVEKAEGCMVKYDAASNTMTVKDRRKKEDTYRVKQATSVLDKAGTVVTKNGSKALLTDLEANRRVIVYWVPDPQNRTAGSPTRSTSPP